MGLIVFPAIDLKGGQVVRLAEGDMDRATVYGDDPAAQAAAFAAAGADHLHVVDLDGAFAGESVNGAAVAAILQAFPGRLQLGGGIRTRESIDRWLDLGVARVVIGTAALDNPDLVRAAARDHPGRIVVAVDARDGMVATRGWADVSNVPVADLARRFEDAGVAALLFTDVGRDGMLKGCNVEATVALARAVSIPVIASGGVTDLRDIEALRQCVGDGIEGVITGRALYDGRLDLAEAIAVATSPSPRLRGEGRGEGPDVALPTDPTAPLATSLRSATLSPEGEREK
jgi:phosphoribosylformimino-5-aminoimidazole carboxamide ribotide isomerase